MAGTAATKAFLYTAANTIDVIFTAGVEAITLLTAGKVEFYLAVADLNALQRATK